MFLYVLLRDLDFAADAAVEIEKKVKCVFRPSSPPVSVRADAQVVGQRVDASEREVGTASREPDAAVHSPCATIRWWMRGWWHVASLSYRHTLVFSITLHILSADCPCLYHYLHLHNVLRSALETKLVRVQVLALLGPGGHHLKSVHIKISRP